MFGLLAAASILGAIAHGFKMPAQVNRLLWQPLNLSLGLAVALFAVGSIYDFRGPAIAKRLLSPMITIGLLFYILTLITPANFRGFIIYEAGVLAFAFCAYGYLALHRRLSGAGLMCISIFIMLIAAVIQASEAVTLTLIWEFDHNGVFHLVQMGALLMLLAGLRSGLIAFK